ncbi:MAG TPA: hypothetical protein VK395_17020 [Gemmataceae bacterium]|nr:hypothetical protein [Gemmataceae bacterium]
MARPQLDRKEIGAAVIGTKSSTGHGVMVRHDRGLPPEANIHPLAEISFPAKTADGGLVLMKLALDQRCCNVRFFAPLQVPIAVSDRQAKITLSFPDWKEGKVAPSTVEVPIGEPTGERKDGKR